MSEPGHRHLPAGPRVVNIGLEGFARDLAGRGVPVVHVDWRPPAHGDVHLAELLSRLDERREPIERANAEAFTRLTGGEATLVDCRPAREAFGLPSHLVLHAGPPIVWSSMCEPMQAAVLCAIRYEGWAANDDAAARLIERQEVQLAPCHHWGAVGPMTGIITASMPVFVVENRRYGNRAYATIEMRDICGGEHPYFRIPLLDERGAPVGIDLRSVIETGLTPLINTGIAGRHAGTGQIGAGIVRAPFACFARALEAFFA